MSVEDIDVYSVVLPYDRTLAKVGNVVLYL